jgi:DUF1365 family protein
MNTDAAPASLYRAEVMHQRFEGMSYRFRYRVFSILLDVDAIDAAAVSTRLFSRNRWNLFSFYDRDHLAAGESDLRSWAERVLAQQGIDGSGLIMRLLCFPRILGFVFNPLSLWYCETRDGSPRAVIAEVRNTFGERHCYVLRPQNGVTDWPLCDSHDKQFHVSPFIGMHARYEFRLSRPQQHLAVAIREYADDQLLLIATQAGDRVPFTSWRLLLEALRVPFQTFKVVGAIHWQALKIWLRGGRFHRKPEAPLEEVS